VGNACHYWLKVVSLKVNLLTWQFLLIHIPTKDNMLIRGVLNSNDHKCVGSCDINEGVDHLFARCEFFGRI